jgi:hypothetical protein
MVAKECLRRGGGYVHIDHSQYRTKHRWGPHSTGGGICFCFECWQLKSLALILCCDGDSTTMHFTGCKGGRNSCCRHTTMALKIRKDDKKKERIRANDKVGSLKSRTLTWLGCAIEKSRVFVYCDWCVCMCGTERLIWRVHISFLFILRIRTRSCLDV